jgi:hypothetical protein
VLLAEEEDQNEANDVTDNDTDADSEGTENLYGTRGLTLCDIDAQRFNRI